MDDVLEKIQDQIDLFCGNLIVGNHDSISLFGASEQAQLKEYSETIARLFLNSNDEIEYSIRDALFEIQKFENRTTTKHSFLSRFRIYRRELTKEYTQIVLFIEQISNLFLLQRAQLLKEIKYLEKLSNSMYESIDRLGVCIKQAEKVLFEKDCILTKPNPERYYPLDAGYTDLQMWYDRLNRKTDDLRISHTTALQTAEELKILHNNDLILLDKIEASINNVFPLWKIQVAILLGIENNTKQREMRQTAALLIPSGAEMDNNRITKLTAEIKSILGEASTLEKKDSNIRCNLQKST